MGLYASVHPKKIQEMSGIFHAWYTMRKHCILSILYHAIENIEAGTINAIYTQNMMDRPGVILSRILCLNKVTLSYPILSYNKN